jgi:hypothetical protein
MRGLVYLLVCLLLVSLHRSDAFLKSSDEWLLPGMYVCACSIQINVLSLYTVHHHYTTLHFTLLHVPQRVSLARTITMHTCHRQCWKRCSGIVILRLLVSLYCIHIFTHIYTHTHSHTHTHTLRRQHQPLHSTLVGVCVE